MIGNFVVSVRQGYHVRYAQSQVSACDEFAVMLRYPAANQLNISKLHGGKDDL
jgi:hypothetical protein